MVGFVICTTKNSNSNGLHIVTIKNPMDFGPVQWCPTSEIGHTVTQRVSPKGDFVLFAKLNKTWYNFSWPILQPTYVDSSSFGKAIITSALELLNIMMNSMMIELGASVPV